MSKRRTQAMLSDPRAQMANSFDLGLVKQPSLQLPFKPFTRAEVEEVTQAPAGLIDALWGKVLPERVGDVGFLPGLDWMGCFAVFVASKWLDEGASSSRVVGAAIFVSNLGHNVMLEEFEQGNDFPAPTPQGGVLVPHPNSPLGNRLNLRALNEEFRYRLDCVFKKVSQVAPS